MADDSHFTLEALEFLLTQEGRGLLGLASALPDTASTVQKLRKTFPAEAVHVALTMARLKEKARRKFPGLERVFSPQEGLEQATSAAVAQHKAGRFQHYMESAGLADAVILDACCSIGGDAMGLARVAKVMAVDLSAVRLFCLRENARQAGVADRIEALCADVTTMDLAGIAAFHVDPARRTAGKRHHAYEDMVPGPEAIERLMRDIPAGAVKLSPGVDFETLPEGHLELIEENASVVQAVLYTGKMSATVGTNTQRTATSIKNGTLVYSFTGAIEPLAALAQPKGFVAEVSPGLHRAGLAPALALELGALPLNSDGGLVTSDAPLRHAAVVCFGHIATLPFNEKKLKALLPTLKHPAGSRGPVEIKSRGHLDLETDKMQKQLSAITDQKLTVLLYKTHEKIVATVGWRMEREDVV